MLKEMRVKRGLTQKQLADLSGVPLAMIRKYEQGVRNIDCAHLYTISELCRALNCKPRDILNDQKLIAKLEEVL